MIQKLDNDLEKVLAYHISGTVTQADVQVAQQEMKSVLDRFGKVRLLIHLGDLEIPKAGAAWQDLKYADVYLTDVERLALVGDASWQEWVTKAVDLPTQGKMRFFDETEIQQAWAWIDNNTTVE
jgi:hypothetical protein